MAYRSLIFLLFLLLACAPVTPSLPPAPSPSLTPYSTPAGLPSLASPQSTATAVTTPQQNKGIWINPAVPAALRQHLEKQFFLASTPETAALILDLELTRPTLTWVYALAAPFPTVRDGVTFEALQQAWRGESLFNGRPLLMEQSTRQAFASLWGEPGPGAVIELPAEALLERAWAEGAFAILPFESLEPRWKVLAVDGISPIRKDFDPQRYPLQIGFTLRGEGAKSIELPPTNRHAERLTTLVLTGVTALVRATAYRMEQKGVLYPGEAIGDWLRQADLAHINNEVPFFSKCPFPDPNQRSLIFCSHPRYIELFLNLGVDLIELAGDHFDNYGRAAMDETLALYRQNGLVYYGGGANLEEATRPLLLEHYGNRLAFLGCNAKKGYAKASETTPGAASCLWDELEAKIRQLRAYGFLVIVTFQHEECYAPLPCYRMVEDFHRVADAGAVIVSGSQAHFPQIMEFYNSAFIHYGLGNLFFDQDERLTLLPEGVRNEFLDRHVFYEGRHISTELLTAVLEDLSRPRPMTPEERRIFLESYFQASGWQPIP